MNRLLFVTTFIFTTLVSISTHSQVKEIKTSPKVLHDFMDKRFGMFIHWGPVTLRGTEIGWSRHRNIPVNEYDVLYKEFNPVLFDADKWAKTAKDAGMKYLTITAKHHDGFCLWPSKFTEYDIMSSPFKRDIVGELAKACKKYDIAFCIYFTILDWHDPDYPLHNQGDTIPDPKADIKKFVGTMKLQLSELINNYHPYMIWFDGNWEKPWTKEYGQEIYNHVKREDPNLIVNNRLGKDNHDKLTSESIGDYATPEQKVGVINLKDPWESCITICNQWAWKPNDKMKSLKESIQTLVTTASGNGNLLFNVGPMMDGRIEERQVNLLFEMGTWLSKNGAAIYGTKGGPYTPNKDYSSTRKGNKIYLHIFNQKNPIVKLGAIKDFNIRKAYFLNGTNVSFKQDENGISIDLPDSMPDAIDSIVVLELDGDAESITIIDNSSNVIRG